MEPIWNTGLKALGGADLANAPDFPPLAGVGPTLFFTSVGAGARWRSTRSSGGLRVGPRSCFAGSPQSSFYSASSPTSRS